jgi:hypothetical protein
MALTMADMGLLHLPALKAALGMRRPLRVVTRQRLDEFLEAARVLDLEWKPVRRPGIDLGQFGRAERFKITRVAVRASRNCSMRAGSEPVAIPASVSEIARCGLFKPT